MRRTWISLLSPPDSQTHPIFLVPGVASHREGVAGGLHVGPGHGAAALHGALPRQARPGVPRQAGADRALRRAPAPHPRHPRLQLRDRGQLQGEELHKVGRNLDPDTVTVQSI